MSTPEQLPEAVRRHLRCTPPHDMDCDLLALPLVGKPSRCDCGLASFLVEIEAAILAALTAARAEATEKERERCAKVADAYRKELARIPACCECSLGPNACEDIAEEIRQGEPQGSQEK